MKFLANFFEDPNSDTADKTADKNNCNDPRHLDDPMGRNQD